MTDDVDHKRRKFLIKATSVVGSLGLAVTAIPFIKSCQPSFSSILAADPLQVDISDLQLGQQLTVEWRSMPIWIIRRTQQQIDILKQDNPNLRDPDSIVDQQPTYARNAYRSIRPEILVLIGICTHLGCIPKLKSSSDTVSQDWQGGFLCPCHGSRFDMAGRVFKNVPAPINLKVPKYTFLNEQTLLIGAEHAV